MGKVLLDTDILSEFLKGYDAVVAGNAARYAQQFGVYTFTSVTVHEIVYGLEMKSAAAQLKKTLHWLIRNEQITPSASDYLMAATIRATAGRQGRVLELPDCLIAAVALRLNLPLVTGNIDDFEAVRQTPAGAKLVIQNWREP